MGLAQGYRTTLQTGVILTDINVNESMTGMSGCTDRGVMQVNIGQLMRGLLGDVTSGETRTMELKVGQVVRGVVLQTLENNEAIVNINGVQVRAKLEMALEPGQSAMLQVQPESNGSLVLLKSVDLNTSGLLDDTFREIAKQLGLPDQKWALSLIRDLRQEGFAFNRTTTIAFQQAAMAMPKGADTEQWMTAAATAFKRGMPMTVTTIASLQQVMFGKPAHELLDQLQRQLTTMTATSEHAGDSPERMSTNTGSRVLTLLQQGASLLSNALTLPETDAFATGRGIGQGGPASQLEGRTGGKLQSEPALMTGGTTADGRGSASEAVSGGMRQGQALTSNNWLGQMMKWMGVDHELQLAKSATDSGLQAAGGKATPTGTNDPSMSRTTGQTTAEAATSNARNIASPQVGVTIQPQGSNAAAIVQPGQLVAEQQAGGESSARINTPDTVTSKTDIGAGASAAKLVGLQDGDGPLRNELSQTVQANNAAAPASANAGSESLKSALMNLVNGSDVPPQIKETAQQLIQQITGQQLLLAPERNNSVFTHVTMFIPLKDASGEQTASVQIQTRRGRRGELDADNCRLLFSLTMGSIGDTLVDVQITDKIVSLQLWNDHPAIADLVETSREELSNRLGGVGYQLLSMRTKPLPQRDDAGQSDNQSVSGGLINKQTAASSSPWLTATRYKGVDYRA
ncbi:hypothetical protein ACX1C1_21205 [Paenibacillus sp. strain BS8-2]